MTNFTTRAPKTMTLINNRTTESKKPPGYPQKAPHSIKLTAGVDSSSPTNRALATGAMQSVMNKPIISGKKLAITGSDDTQ